MSVAPVATGTITLDRDKAKAKLRRFQLADPCAWLLELVRAAVVQGARAITVRTDADDVRVAFDGTGFTVADVEHLYEALLARRAPPARQHLAAALNGALALGPRFVELHSRGADGGVRLRLEPGRDDAFGPANDEPDGDEPTTTVWLRHPFRIGAFVEFFRARLGTQREIAALRHACRFLDVPLSINGRPLTSAHPKSGTRKVRCAGAKDGAVFAVDAVGALDSGRLMLCYRGVMLEEVVHERLPAGVCALVHGDHLTRDASLGAFVRDAAWSALVDAALLEALVLCEREGGALLGHAVHRLGPALLGQGEAQDPFADTPLLRAALAKAGRPLFRHPVLRGVDDAPLTLGDLAKVLRAGRALPIAARSCRVLRSGDPVALVDDQATRALVEHLVGDRHQSGEALLAEAERRDNGRRRLQERRGALALPPGRVLGRASANGGHARTLVALRPGGVRLRLSLHTDGCLIGVHDVDTPLPGISMALEAPFTLAVDGTDVVRDEVFARALRVAFAALPDALADACANAADREALAARALPMLAWCLDPEALWAKLAEGLSLPKLADLPPLPELVIVGNERHPVTGVPCVPRIDRTLASLDELRGKQVPVVPVTVEQFSIQHAVRAGSVLRAVLARVAELDPQDDLAAREERRARLLAGPATLRAPYPPVAEFRLGDDAKGWVCFSSQQPGVVLEAHIERRALPVVKLDDGRLGALRVVVDDPHLLPLANGNLGAPDVKRLARAGLGAAGALLETAAGNPGANSRGRRLALALVTALCPSQPLARAAELLDAAEFLALRALSLVADGGDLEPLIELALEAGLRPTVTEVRELAHAAGTKLPKRGATDQDARSLLLAPFGGLHGLRDFDDDVPLRARVLRRLPALAGLELHTIDGLVTLEVLLAEPGPVRFVSAGFPLADGVTSGRRVLRLNDEEHVALRALLGPSALADASAELREQIARRRHEAKPIEPATLEGALYPQIVPLVVDGARGQLGLQPPQSSEPAAHLRVLAGGRFVKRIDLSALAPCSFAAVLDDPELPLDVEGEALARRLGVLGASCIGAADSAIDLLAAALPAERPNARARACLLERLAHKERHPIDLERLGKLSGRPLVDTIHGRWASLDQLVAEAQRYGGLAFVASAPRGQPPRELVLVLAVACHRALVAAAVGCKVEDVAAAWQRHTERQEVLGRYPPLPTPPTDAFEVAEAAVAGVRVALWVGPETRGARVAGGIEGRQIGTIDLETVLPAVEGTVVGEAVLDPTFSFVTLARAWPAVDVAATALATRLVELQTAGTASAPLTEWCRRLVLRLAASPDAHGKRLGPLLGRLRAHPLFPAPDDGLLSLDQVLATRPEALEDDLLAHGLVRASDPAPPPRPAPRAPTPDEALLARLTELLTLLSLDEPARAELARWPLLVVRRKGKQLARFTRTHCEVDVEHPLGRAALDGDPAALDLVCAVVVGAANHHLEEIDGRHERGFLARLLALAATRGA